MNSDRPTLRWWLDSVRNCNQRNHFRSKLLIRDTHDSSLSRISTSARFWAWMKAWETNHYSSWVSRASETDTHRFSCMSLSRGRNFRHNWFKWFEFRALSNHHRRVERSDRSEFIKGIPKTIPDPVEAIDMRSCMISRSQGSFFLRIRCVSRPEETKIGKQRRPVRVLVWDVHASLRGILVLSELYKPRRAKSQRCQLVLRVLLLPI